nr:M23 family metallopeptidase [Streptomyces sp. SID14478]
MVNDRHPSGTAYDAAYDGYSTTSFAADPLFGDLPGNDPYSTGTHDTGSYDTGSGSFGTGAFETGSYDTGSYDTGQWPAAGHQQYAAPYASPAYDHTSGYDTGSYDTTAMWAGAGAGAGYEQQHTGQWPAQSYETQTFESPVFGTTAYDTGAYDATAWNSDASTAATAVQDTPHTHAMPHVQDASHTQAMPHVQDASHTQPMPQVQDTHEHIPDQYSPAEYAQAHDEHGPEHAPHGYASGPDPERAPDPDPTSAEPTASEPTSAESASGEGEFTPRAAPRGGRSRRRTPTRRSALLTVAVPSVCVVGVAGVAAASVMGGGDDGKDTQAASAPDATAVKPAVANNKLDTQLKEMSADAGDFADRASRTQERIDLKAKQEADRKKAAAEAKRKEALRPKFALPIKQRGLSAYYGQAGINWMSVHTGIDFPVSYGTEVMAATDGTVRTQWNSAYGNMAIVTAKDGTETWYCHLSTHTVMSGPVKAGDVIARSGNSGNSTGPHMHFEVRPGGGSAIDPLPWLRSHGLDPT